MGTHSGGLQAGRVALPGSGSRGYPSLSREGLAGLGAAAGALAGTWTEIAHGSGGLWTLALAAAGAYLGWLNGPAPPPAAGPSRPLPGSGTHGSQEPMASMSCATLGGTLGALAGFGLAQVAAGLAGAGMHPGAAHGMASDYGQLGAHLAMALMSGAMGGMVGASIPGCRLPRQSPVS